MALSFLKKWRQDQASWFVVNMVIVYAVWKAFSYYVKNSYGQAHHIWIKIIICMGSTYAAITSFILNIFGEKTTSVGIAVVYPELVRSIRVEDHCLAIPATVIFVGTIVLFKGPWKTKLWFIPLGIFFIVIINLVRLVFVCETFVYFTRQFFEINHSIVYVILTYSLVFLMIVWWMKKFAESKKEISL